VVPQSLIRCELLTAIVTSSTKRTELGPHVRHRRPDVRQSLCGMRLSPVQYAQLTPDAAWDRDVGLGCASCVAMMQPADHRECDDVSLIGRLALAEVGGVLVEREVGPGPMIVLEVLP
jgi:hypothetical protein